MIHELLFDQKQIIVLILPHALFLHSPLTLDGLTPSIWLTIQYSVKVGKFDSQKIGFDFGFYLGRLGFDGLDLDFSNLWACKG